MFTRVWNWLTNRRSALPSHPVVNHGGARAGEITMPASLASVGDRTQKEIASVRAKAIFLSYIQATQGSQMFAVRGSLSLLAWVGTSGRLPYDIDLVLLPRYSRAQGRRAIQEALAVAAEDEYQFQIAHESDLQNYSKAPGRCYWLDFRARRTDTFLQVDVAEGEYMPLPPEPMELTFAETQQQVTVLCAPPELALAWKLRWMLTDSRWQHHDLFDALLMLRYLELDPRRLQMAIEGLFRHHETETIELYRFLDRTMVNASLNRYWRRMERLLLAQMPSQEAALTDLAERLTRLLNGQLGLPRAPELPFFQAALAMPADANARLVYADWLEEQDDPRAELVRLDLELSTTAASRPEQVARHAALLTQANATHPGWAARVCRWAAPQE